MNMPELMPENLPEVGNRSVDRQVTFEDGSGRGFGWALLILSVLVMAALLLEFMRAIWH